MELIIMNFPFFMYSILILYPVLYFLNLDLPVLLISSFPAPFQNFYTISLCLAMETTVIAIYITWNIYFNFVILSFVTTFVTSLQVPIKILLDEQNQLLNVLQVFIRKLERH